jgi:hypothetical protein
VDPPKYSLFLFSQIKKRRPLFASQRASCQPFCDFFINHASIRQIWPARIFGIDGALPDILGLLSVFSFILVYYIYIEQ